jgi:hypothetical protein
MVAVVVNWTSTIGIFLLTGEAVIMKRYYILKVCSEMYHKMYNNNELIGNGHSGRLSDCPVRPSICSGYFTGCSRLWCNKCVTVFMNICTTNFVLHSFSSVLPLRSRYVPPFLRLPLLTVLLRRSRWNHPKHPFDQPMYFSICRFQVDGPPAFQGG